LEFASAIIDCREAACSRAGIMRWPILRSGTSPYPNHGEPRTPNTGRFHHKLKVCLKELRESAEGASHTAGKNFWAKDEPNVLLS